MSSVWGGENSLDPVLLLFYSDPATGTLLECKALGFEKKMSRLGDFQEWYQGAEDPFNQMAAQHGAGRDREVLWHVAEKRFADKLEKYREDKGYENVTVRHTPATKAELEAFRAGKTTTKLALMEWYHEFRYLPRMS